MPGSYPIETSCSSPQSSPARRGHCIAGLAVLVLLVCGAGGPAWSQVEPPPNPAQEQPQPNEPANAAGEPGTPEVLPFNGARAAVHGAVKNQATGEPIPRALVRIEGDAVSGALTDGEGRFEIASVPVGPQAFQVMKPGFIDAASAGAGGPISIINGNSNSEHNVQVIADMPDLVFTLSPTNAIHGEVELSSGDPAQGIAVMLLRRVVQDGRALWQPVTNARTNSEGAYRFAGLTDGAYAVYTEPTMDSEVPAVFVAAGSDQAVARAGYPSVFYPDTRDLAGASRIQVGGGQQAQANLLLTEEPFHLVRATLTLPGAGSLPAGAPLNVSVTVLDGKGRQLPYSGMYDPATRGVQAFLPDGTYMLQVTAANAPRVYIIGGRRPMTDRDDVTHGGEGPLVGQVEFSVAGHAVTHLQIPLAEEHSNTVQVSLIRSGAVQQAGNSNAQPIVIMVSQASGWISDGMVTSYAEGYATGPIETSANMGPGPYWVHTSIPQRTYCEGSFTAGAASLAREPLLVSLTGATAPLTLTLRDDCARLELSLPPDAAVSAAGDERYYTIYVVPDFDSTADITPVTLRPSSGGKYTMEGLTPGSYHVYTFANGVELEYRNPDAMAALPHPGQAVMLAPGGSASLVVEVPGS